MKRILVLLAGMVCVAGCTTTSTVSQLPGLPGETSRNGEPVVYRLSASNTGVFLLYFLPVWSGKYTKPNRADYDCFENNVQQKYLRMMLDERCRKLGAERVVDFRMNSDCSGWLGLGILWRRSIHASAVAVGGDPDRKVKKKEDSLF